LVGRSPPQTTNITKQRQNKPTKITHDNGITGLPQLFRTKVGQRAKVGHRQLCSALGRRRLNSYHEVHDGRQMTPVRRCHQGGPTAVCGHLQGFVAVAKGPRRGVCVCVQDKQHEGEHLALGQQNNPGKEGEVTGTQRIHTDAELARDNNYRQRNIDVDCEGYRWRD